MHLLCYQWLLIINSWVRTACIVSNWIPFCWMRMWSRTPRWKSCVSLFFSRNRPRKTVHRLYPCSRKSWIVRSKMPIWPCFVHNTWSQSTWKKSLFLYWIRFCRSIRKTSLHAYSCSAMLFVTITSMKWFVWLLLRWNTIPMPWSSTII